MDSPVAFLYLLGMDDGKTYFVNQGSFNTPLGAIRLAGKIIDSTGANQGPRRRLGAYALVYSLEGSCDYWDELNGHRTIGAGQLFTVFPEIAHRYGRRGLGWNEFFILFEGPLFDLWRAQGILDPRAPPITLKPVPYWLAQWESCLETHGLYGEPAGLRQVSRLQQVFLEALAVTGPASRPRPRWLPAACEALEAPLSAGRSLPDLARDLGLSFESFRKKFTDFVGMPPAKYRTKHLMDEACRLVAERELTGKEIAERLGFSDEYHFSKRFKEIVGLSPRDFRANYRSGSGP